MALTETGTSIPFVTPPADILEPTVIDPEVTRYLDKYPYLSIDEVSQELDRFERTIARPARIPTYIDLLRDRWIKDLARLRLQEIQLVAQALVGFMNPSHKPF